MIKLVKIQSKDTYKDKEGNEKHYYNYFLVSDNGKKIQIRCSFPKQDQKILDYLAEYQPVKK